MKVRIGTRGSMLALVQARFTVRLLAAHGLEAEVVIIKTQGDQKQDRPFAEVGAPGVFVREIERALQERKVDLAVHSFKDLPSDSSEDLVIAAVPQRVNPADVMLCREPCAKGSGPLPDLAEGACVGTASARRRALLVDLRPDLRVEMLRGNVPTRLRRLRDGNFDAILLAAAGLHRLGEDPETASEFAGLRQGLTEHRLDPAIFVPAPTQGALAWQTRRDDEELRERVAALQDRVDLLAIRAERDLLRRIQGNCDLPFGAWCRGTEDGALEMFSVCEMPGELRRVQATGSDPEELASRIHKLLEVHSQEQTS